MARINRDDVDKFHDYALYIPKRAIYLGSESVAEDGQESGVEATMAQRLIKNLAILDGLSNDDITIIMNNPGGDIIHGMAIYDAIKSCQSHVTIKVLGYAMSMGSIILQAADERVLGPNSRVMIHYGTFGMDSHAKTVYKWTEENKKYDKWMENMYLEKIRQKQAAFKLKTLQKMLDFDTILTPEEAISLGLADKILGKDNKE